MNVANQYNLFFNVSSVAGFTPRPCVSTQVINGNNVNNEIASFIETNGIELTQHIIDQINLYDYSISFGNYEVWGHNDSESVEVRNNLPNPPVAVFNTGGSEVRIPLSDFLQILQEWITFLQTVPNPHWLSNR